jgi:uncharacterized protein (TIGR00251 family)
VLITVHLKPGARQNRVVKQLDDSTYVVEVTAPPVQGKANKALIELLAAHFDVPKLLIELKRGATTRIKQLEIPMRPLKN